MSKVLRVYTDGLAADGRDLANVGTTPKHEQCRQPASDPVSVSMSMAMSAHDESFVQRLGEAEQVREHGGALVTASAVLFDQADEANSLMIGRVEVLGNARRTPGAPPSINIPPRPNTRGTQRVPKVDRQSMDAEDFSDAIHTGQGSDVVTDFADRWSKEGDNIQRDADRTRRISDSVQEHWADADANAATKIRDHGTWLNAAEDWADNFSTQAANVASAFDTAKRNTPTPEEFEAAKRNLKLGSILSPAAGLAAYAHLERLKAKAIEAGATYEGNVRTAVEAVGKTIGAPPLIGKQAAIPPELVKGPGTWATEVRNEGAWRDYELQVTGTPAEMEYEIPRESGDPIAFDGFDPDAGDNGLLLEAKGNGYHWMVGPDGDFKDIPPAIKLEDQITRQFEAARDAGIPVEWRVAEPNVAEAIQRYIEDNGYDEWVSVTHVPAA